MRNWGERGTGTGINTERFVRIFLMQRILLANRTKNSLYNFQCSASIEATTTCAGGGGGGRQSWGGGEWGVSTVWHSAASNVVFSHWLKAYSRIPKDMLESTFDFIICLDEDEPENGEDEEGEATTSDQESEDEQGLMSPASQSGSRQASNTGAGNKQGLMNLFISNSCYLTLSREILTRTCFLSLCHLNPSHGERQGRKQ